MPILRILRKIFEYFYRRNIKKLEAQTELVNNLSLRIDEIKKYEKYLTNSDKEKLEDTLLRQIKNIFFIKLKKYKKVLSSDYINKYENIRSFKKNIYEFFENYNQIFIKKESERYKSFFENIESNPLTESQIKASLIDEKNNLIVAGAGSGKTSVIISKIGYLLQKKLTDLDNIIILTFTNESKIDLIKRASERLAKFIPVEKLNILTFHQLGLILREKANVKKKRVSDLASSRNEFLKWIDSIIIELFDDKKHKQKIIKYFASYTQPFESIHEFDDRGKYLNTLRKTGCNRTLNIKNKLTFQREIVKSFEECEIANFLFLNQIKYTYEKPYHIDISSSKQSSYRPDFTLINDAGERVYLEHFALDKNGEAPHFFNPGYKENVEMKKQKLLKDKSKCIFTYSHQKKSGELLNYLEKQLIKNGFTIRPLSAEQIIKVIRETKELTKFSRLIATFLNHFKSEDLNIGQLKLKTQVLPNMVRNMAFIDIFEIILTRYQNYLGHYDMDFNDMINETEKIISANPQNIESPYDNIKYVLIDEFQDISVSRYKLIKSLRKVNENIKFFCVGDDWQSIYKFGGSNIGIMTEFNKNFGDSVIMKLEDNFRFGQSMTDISSFFIQKNKNQIPKTITSHNQLIKEPITIVREINDKEKNDITLSKILKNIRDKDKHGEIMVLGRYNFSKPDDFQNIINNFDNKGKIYFKTVHGSKGLEADYVIVLNLNSGQYGFPSEITNDPILDLVIKNNEKFLHAEERRLFYVALTRAKKDVYLTYKNNPISTFINELKNSEYKMKYINQDKAIEAVCPICSDSIARREQKINKNNKFYSCRNILCDFTLNIPSCRDCNSEKKLIEINNSTSYFVCSNCEITDNESDEDICVFPY